MKIMLISVKSTVSRGGIAVWTERFLSRCSEENVECRLVNTELVGNRLTTGKRNLWEEMSRTRKIFRDLKHLLKTEHFDAAYLNTSCGNFGLFRDEKIAKLIHKKGIPLITQYHCEIPWWIRSRMSCRSLGKLVECSTENLVLCQNSKNFLRKHYQKEAHKIPNFVLNEMILPYEKEIRETVENICFVGRVSETKGAKELYEVARQLPKVQFSLVGEVSPAVKTWEKPKNVLLLGLVPQKQVLEQLDRADLFLFPSHTEGCSMALMEAMARGLPCIATDVGANADMLGGGNGVIVAKHDVDAMVSAVQLLQDPVLRKTISRNAVKQIRDHYTEKNVSEILAVAKSVCRNN